MRKLLLIFMAVALVLNAILFSVGIVQARVMAETIPTTTIEAPTSTQQQNTTTSQTTVPTNTNTQTETTRQELVATPAPRRYFYNDWRVLAILLVIIAIIVVVAVAISKRNRLKSSADL